jgi:hypothetical protein
MTTYSDSPFYQRKTITPGIPAYSFGSFNDRSPGSRMSVTSVSILSDVATLGVILREGDIPVVGQLVSVEGTQTAGGEFNVTSVAISAVAGFNTGDNSVGTISFALSEANVATTSDSGQAYAPPPILAEAMTETAGQQFAVAFPSGFSVGGRTVSYSWSTPSAPDSATVELQGSIIDQDDQYVSLDSQDAEGTYEVEGVNMPFLRGSVTAVSGGTNPTIIFQILI